MGTTTCAESDRLAALYALGILDTPEDAHFDAVCRTARRLFGVGTAVVSLIDAERQWLKTPCSLVPQTVPRSETFCDHTIRDDAVFVVSDATKDARFASSRFVAGSTHLRFYAGAPLILREGVRVGALCLLDTQPRAFTAEEEEALRDLAAIVVAHLRLSEVDTRLGHEVVARRGSESAFARSQARYQGLAQALPLLVWTARTSDWIATFTNACFDDYFGSERHRRAESVHPADLAPLERAWGEAIATGEPLRIESRLKRRDGAYRWHKIVAIPIPQVDEAAPAEWLGTALDIDDIVTARKRLEETGNLLHMALESANAGTWDWDMRRGVATLAPESVRIYGLPGSEPLSFTTAEWTQMLHPDDREPTWDAVRRAIETREHYLADFRVVTDGMERWMRASGRTFYDADGKPYRMVGLHFDVTERKKVEAALEAATAAAEAARLDAEHASASKSDFLAAMSHEIRTPLNGILGYADLLLEGRHHRPDDRHQLELIQSSGAALLTVVNDILDFSKIEAGQLELDPTPFALEGLVDNTVSIVAGSCLKSPLRMSCDFDAALPDFVTGDEGRLRQVLLNLLNNAVKFTPAGSVTLRVRHEAEVTLPGGEPAHAMRFEITDTGIGIAANQRDRLFKRFSQVDGSISRRFGGSGLGLAICRHLVTMMGGEIGVESTVGVGSTFWFRLTLPRCENLPELTAAFEEASPPPTVATPVSRAPRLLLVEDVKINQDLARAVLEVNGYRVEVAGDGVEALAAIQALAGDPDPYDVVLMDVQMPGMDGLTATRRIRALGWPACDLPIIAMTANVLPDQIADLREAGMDDHVGKPFKRAELYAAIERWLGRHSGTPPQDAGSAAAIDATMFDAMRAQVGTARVRDLLGMLERELGARFAPAAETPPAYDRERLAQDAHAMVSAAGLLGFVEVAALCREIETACRDERDLTELMHRFTALREGTIREIRTLRAA